VKVLIQNRPDTFQIIGGDTIQMIKTAEYLKKLGVDVDISLQLNPKLDKYDIVHLMNITRVTHTYLQLKNAKKQKKKVVLSPIYWNTKDVVFSYFLRTFSFIKHIYDLKDLSVAVFQSIVNRTFFAQASELFTNNEMTSFVLANVDCILPNSHAELKILRERFPKVFEKKRLETIVVPNGVDKEVFYNASPKSFEDKYQIKDFVLNVGRFSFRKNQLSLIRALKGTGLRVVFIGESSKITKHYAVKDTIDKLYYQQCIRESDESFIFLGSMSHEELASAYAACKVFALPSLYETPGLSALEAALAGANVCITSKGSTREYFSGYAFYCDPYDICSIKRAILQAYDTPKSGNLKEHVLRNFTWDHVAKATLEAYMQVLKK